MDIIKQRRGIQECYRSTKPIPSQLLDHCTVCLEEQLYCQAFELFSCALISGTGSALPAQIPPPQYLALAATLTVHPSFTNRTRSEDKHDAANKALRYIQDVLTLCGSRASGIYKAFQYKPKPTSSRCYKKQVSGRRQAQVNSDSEDESGRLHSTYASTESLWQNAEDFWSVIGWAFNCSVAHRARWVRWKLWLEVMLDTLEVDLKACVSEDCVHESIFAQYLNSIGESRNNKRRLMRAILADGKQKSLAEFGEIWRNETQPPKPKKGDDRFGSNRKLDVENGEFGDYFDDSDNESREESARNSTSQRKVIVAGDQNSIEGFGGVDSMNFRRRILALLIQYCTIEPHTFLDTDDLLDLYTEFLRPLPLPIFRQFVLPSKPWLDSKEQFSLDQMLLRPLLSHAVPVYDENAITQQDFELHFAPFCSNLSNVVDNAKLSLLVEDLLRLLWRMGRLSYSEALKVSVEEGIEARRCKVLVGGRRKAGFRAAEDEEARAILEHSGKRMLAILDMIQ
ncbi:hypothetical protein M433DRAFT_57801 [Acidomyces richmondensis BFW]|nr:MAG: hypothetical protein FE78DRAFT_143861 [Acidomyces sp. 'richmondensis']KYG50103.1 hypothetical protein M433DRAFT_57801 [Acidomyces richmondensis BFW]